MALGPAGCGASSRRPQVALHRAAAIFLLLPLPPLSAQNALPLATCQQHASGPPWPPSGLTC
jgi:hypothetical protein